MLGREVRLIPPACVKAFVWRQTNDVASAGADQASARGFHLQEGVEEMVICHAKENASRQYRVSSGAGSAPTHRWRDPPDRR